MRPPKLAGTALTWAIVVTTATGSVINVTSDSGGLGGPDCTLRDAIVAANSDVAVGGCSAGSGADTIELPAAASIVLSELDNAADGNNGLPSVVSVLTINGHGSSVRRSDAEGTPPMRILHIAGNGHLTLNDLTVDAGLWIGNADINGGGIHNSGILLIDTCTISNNTAACAAGCVNDVGDGGGIYNSPTGTLTMTDTTLSFNTADNDGGAVYNRGLMTHTGGLVNGNTAEVDGGGLNNTVGSMMIVSGTTFNGNTANKGGAAYNFGSMSLNTCSITSAADNKGGGLFNSGDATLTRCVVTGCSAFIGAGVSGQFGRLTLNECTVDANTATAGVGGGGGISIEVGTLIVNRTTVSHNTAVADGGGILNSGTVDLINSTISGNTSTQGAGIYSWIAGTVTIDHCTISDNTATGDGGGGGLGDDGSATTTITHSIVAHSSSDTDCAVTGTLIDGGHNIIEDGTCITAATSTSGDPQIGALRNNGGPTLTHTPAPDSPAVDAIPLSACPLEIDQRGVPRPQGLSACDMGAVEFVEAIPALGPLALLVLGTLIVLAGTVVVHHRSQT